MAPKKGGKKKGKKKKGGPVGFVSVYTRHVHEEEAKARMLYRQKDFVMLTLKLIDWKFANIDMPVRTNTLLSTIVQQLRIKHGAVQNFKLYKNPPNAPSSEVKNFDQPVSGLAFEGGTYEEMMQGQHSYTLFYDFKVTSGYTETLEFLKHGDVSAVAEPATPKSEP